MIIPLGVDHSNFLYWAIDNKIRVTSKYQGVYLHGIDNKPGWMARYQGKIKSKYLGKFPLTEEGEKQASKMYLNYLNTIGMKPRYKKKKERKLKLKGGDSGHIGEELLMGTSEIKRKGFVIEQVIEEDYFSLREALIVYEMDIKDWIKYLKNKNKNNT